MNLKSIRWRIQAWHGALLTLVVAGLMTGFYFYARHARLRELTSELHGLITPMLPKITRGEGEPRPERGPRGDFMPPPDEDFREPPPGRPRPPGPDAGQALFSTPQFFYQSWYADGTARKSSGFAPVNLPKPRREDFDTHNLTRQRGDFIEAIYFLPNDSVALFGASVAPVEAEMRQLVLWLVGTGLGVIVLGLAGGWWFAGRSLKPISAISEAAGRIATGDLARRIDAQDTESELGQLVTVLNSTFTRLEAAFAQQQQFTSDAAHELRTPVSVILAQTQSILNRERTPAEYRETLEACERAAQRMKRLIESLLELARFDGGQEKMRHEKFDLASLAQECAEHLCPIATTRNVKLIYDLAAVPCGGDAERIGQIITNLVTNAIHYNRPGGEVRITARTEEGCAVLAVADTGQGIAAEDLPHLFERFYRADKARTNTGGSSGLGLAICQAIATAHGGSITVKSEPGAGSSFELRLPAHRSADR